MKKSLFFVLSALSVAGLLVPAPAVAECYDPPGAYVVWSKCDFARKNFEGADLSALVRTPVARTRVAPWNLALKAPLIHLVP